MISRRNALLTLWIALASAVPAIAADDPWSLLDTVRSRLAEGGSRTARFEQTFLPAGFESGEVETGRLDLALPDCLRWDYLEPYPKSFLICENTVHYWNSEDRQGRRQRIDRENEPGLDLLLLQTTELRKRYAASLLPEAEGQEGTRIRLLPLSEAGDIQEATLTLDLAAGRVEALEYRDREGNRTRFTLHELSLLTEAGRFEPPSGITWEDG